MSQRGRAALGGSLVALSGAAVAEGCAAALGTVGPTRAVSEMVRDQVPGPLALTLIHLVGHWDKPLLVAGTVAGLASVGALAGITSLRSRRLGYAVFGLLALLCLAVSGPLMFSKGLQTFPTWKEKVRYDQFNSAPVCLVKAAVFIKDNSQAFDIIQDSENDRRFVVAALAERQLFAGESIFGKPEKILQERLDDLNALRNTQNGDELERYARDHHISWYLLHPETPVAWPSAFLETASFNCDGYRVFRFSK